MSAIIFVKWFGDCVGVTELNHIDIEKVIYY